MKIFVFVFSFFAFFIVSAQVVVESPETDGLLISQMLLINNLANIDQNLKTEQFAEYIAQFVNVISEIKENREIFSNMSKITKILKEKTTADWLSEVNKEMKEVFPEISDFVASVSEGVAESGAYSGKYAGYVAGWSADLEKYHEALLANYGTHKVFPALFPSFADESDFFKKESSRKIVHKSWIESGMEYEMKDDAARASVFRRYYEEYLKNAKENNNIEALGLANLMQASYISAETLEHIRKNLDVSVMAQQFGKDFSQSYLEFLRKKRLEKENKKKKSIFGF